MSRKTLDGAEPTHELQSQWRSYLARATQLSVFTLGLMFMTSSCRGTHEATETEEAQALTDEQTQVSKPGAAAAAEARVQVLDEGEEPRRRLRYQFTAGNHHALKITNEGQRTSKSLLGASESGDTTVSHIDIEVESATPSRAVLVATLSHVFVDSASLTARIQADQLKKQTEGRRFRVAVDSQGMLTFVEETTAGFSDLLSNLVVPLPTQAVGKGARWRYVGEFNAPGTTQPINLRLDFTLTKSTGTRITLITNTTFEDKGGSVKKEGYSVAGVGGIIDGERIVDLTRPVPISGFDNAQLRGQSRLGEFNTSVSASSKIFYEGM